MPRSRKDGSDSLLKKAQRPAPWIPAFAGMTEDGTFSPAVIPAKAGIQKKQDSFNGLLRRKGR